MKTALLVIDVQKGLFDPEPRPHEADVVIERINALGAAARAAGCPVVFIQHERPSSALAYQTDGWRLVSSLDAQSGDAFIRKTTPDSFLRTHLQETLESHDIGRVVVAGYASEFCVDTTVRRAAALGYEVVLASDAHTTHDKQHASAMAIRTHENETLPGITSFGPKIQAIRSTLVAFAA